MRTTSTLSPKVSPTPSSSSPRQPKLNAAHPARLVSCPADEEDAFDGDFASTDEDEGDYADEDEDEVGLLGSGDEGYVAGRVESEGEDEEDLARAEAIAEDLLERLEDG